MEIEKKKMKGMFISLMYNLSSFVFLTYFKCQAFEGMRHKFSKETKNGKSKNRYVCNHIHECIMIMITA